MKLLLQQMEVHGILQMINWNQDAVPSGQALYISTRCYWKGDFPLMLWFSVVGDHQGKIIYECLPPMHRREAGFYPQFVPDQFVWSL